MNKSLIVGLLIGMIMGAVAGILIGRDRGEKNFAAESIYRNADTALAIAGHLRANKTKLALDEAENELRFAARTIPQLGGFKISGPIADRTSQIAADLARYHDQYLKGTEPFYPLREPLK